MPLMPVSLSRRAVRRLATALALAVVAGAPVVFPAPVSAATPVGRWDVTGSLTKVRDFHTTTRRGDGSVLVAGGTTGGPATATAERYDPGTGTWARTGSLNITREGHTATLLA